MTPHGLSPLAAKHLETSHGRESAVLLIETSTPETVRDALLKLIDDPDLLAQLQTNAHNASEQYNWEVAKTRLQTLYAHLIPK